MPKSATKKNSTTTAANKKGASSPSKGKKNRRGKKGKNNRRRSSFRNSVAEMMSSDKPMMRGLRYIGSVVAGTFLGVVSQVLLAKTTWSAATQDGVLGGGGLVIGGLATFFNMPALGAGIAGATGAIAVGRTTARWMASSSSDAVRAQAAALLGGAATTPALPAPSTAAAPAPATTPAGLPMPVGTWSYPTGVPTSNARINYVPASQTQPMSWG